MDAVHLLVKLEGLVLRYQVALPFVSETVGIPICKI